MSILRRGQLNNKMMMGHKNFDGNSVGFVQKSRVKL